LNFTPVSRQRSHVLKSDIWALPFFGRATPTKIVMMTTLSLKMYSDIHSQFRAHTVNSILLAVYQFSLILIYVLTLCEIHDLPRIRENPLLSETTKIAIHEYQ